MPASLIAASIWALTATLTALLPMCMQFRFGLALLLTAPPLLIWINTENGPWITALAVLALLSMFRKPLAYLTRKALQKLPKT